MPLPRLRPLFHLPVLPAPLVPPRQKVQFRLLRRGLRLVHQPLLFLPRSQVAQPVTPLLWAQAQRLEHLRPPRPAHPLLSLTLLAALHRGTRMCPRTVTELLRRHFRRASLRPPSRRFRLQRRLPVVKLLTRTSARLVIRQYVTIGRIKETGYTPEDCHLFHSYCEVVERA